MPNQPKAGRPRRTLDWASTLRYNLPVSFAKDRDIHTALFLSGTSAVDMVMCAIREYITNHPEQTGHAIDPEVQRRVAAKALAIAMGVDDLQAPTTIPVVSIEKSLSAEPASHNWVSPLAGYAASSVAKHQTSHSEMVRPPPTEQTPPMVSVDIGATNHAPRVSLVSDVDFPDDDQFAKDNEARRLEAARQFALNQLKDA